MRKFNPQEYNREQWGDGKTRTKHKPAQCSEHKYCNIAYEWQEEGAEHGNIISFIGREEGQKPVKLPPNSQHGQVITYDMMTEETLDDWFAQSINRTIPSMLNPQKKFYVPSNIDEQLKTRNAIPKTKNKHFDEDTYFPRRKDLTDKEKEEQKKHPIKSLFYNPLNLQPKVLAGTPIRLRQPQQHVKNDIRRRNAVLLLKDIHYARFLKKMSKPAKQKVQEQPAEEEYKPKERKNMIYSFNMESMLRKGCDDDVPNSIIERQFQKIKKPQKDFITANRNTLQKQEQIQEKTRLKINEKAAQTLTKIDQMVAKDTQQTRNRVNSGIRKRTSTVGTRVGKNATVGANNTGAQIEQKVLKLLNSMQVVSEYIDVEMANLNIHLAQTMVQHSSDTIQHKWIRKAQEKIRQKQNLLAIDCYKQALILQPDSFIPIFNIAILLEKEKMLSYAKEWFLLAKEKDTETEKVSFGLALVLVKQLNFQAALRQIDELIQRLEKEHRRKVDMTYYYLRALCYKKLGQFEKAKSDYELIFKVSKPSNYYSLSYFLLSIVFAKSRRCKQKFNCLSYMSWRQSLYLLFYEKSKKIKEDGMNSADFVEKLSKQQFFNRFSKNLLRKFIQKGTYEQIKKETIIFASEEESFVVVNGLVTILSHQKSITNPDTVTVLGQGGVIGAGDIDYNLCDRPNYWFLAKTDIEVIRISRAQFRLFWQGQITFELDYKYNFLKNVGLFKGLPDSTLFMLCEHIELKQCHKGQILFNDCSYRNQLLSKQGLGFCLGKQNVDPRFVNVKKLSKSQEMFKRHRTRARIVLLLKKYTFKFNEMKFNRLKFRGLYILVDGKVQIQDDRGFRCKDIMSPRDYFGENLLINSEGFHNYGRMVVDSPTAKFFLLNTDKMRWLFTSLDKQLMTSNAKNRKQIETIRFLRNRFNECLEVKMAKLLAKRQ